MRNEVSRPIIELLLDHADRRTSWRTEATSIPAANYVDPDHLSREQDRLFDRMPRVAALSPDLPDPGSTLTRDQFSVPLLLTRDGAGEVHAFANVCAHRGAQVVPDGRDQSRRMACPYHAWTYDLDGTLVGLPDAAAFPSVCVPGPGLRTLGVREEHGLIWVDPAAGLDGTSLVPPAIADDLRSFDIDAHDYWRSHRFALNLNWKLVIDTFLEPYHFASLHRNTVGPLFMANLCHADRFGSHVREVLPRKTLDELRNQDPDTWDVVPHSALVYVLFPNTVFVMQIDHIETWRVVPHPTDPGRSVCDLDFYIPSGELTESAARHWEKNWKLTIDTVIDEDFAAMAGVQQGLASGVLGEVRVGANEPALGLFHQSLADAMATDPDSV